jgi:SAM-dependent methyltransferase
MDASYAAGYDEVLYDSVPVVGSHPAQLAAWATLHGLSAPPVATARILELGCGTGSNIVPIAADLPDAEVVAIDLSARQIERASARAAALGLTNLTCHALDLREVDGRFGSFDYVIAHGLYSWVPAEVRDAALALLGARLSPDGLAYVSFLTLPGWSFAGAFRRPRALPPARRRRGRRPGRRVRRHGRAPDRGRGRRRRRAAPSSSATTSATTRRR